MGSCARMLIGLRLRRTADLQRPVHSVLLWVSLLLRLLKGMPDVCFLYVCETLIESLIYDVAACCSYQARIVFFPDLPSPVFAPAISVAFHRKD